MARADITESTLPTSELIKIVARNSGVSQEKIKKVYKATEDAVLEALVQGQRVRFHGVASVYLKRPYSMTISDVNSPGTPLKVEIPAKVRVGITDYFQERFQEMMNKGNKSED